MKRPLGDRRIRTRFEVVGVLWGLLECPQVARIVNISTTGALIESPLAVAVGSTQSVRLRVDGEEMLVDTEVRHVRRADAVSGKYLIGVRFVSPALPLVHSIEAFADTGGEPIVRT